MLLDEEARQVLLHATQHRARDGLGATGNGKMTWAGGQQGLTFQLLLLIVNIDNVACSPLVDHRLFIRSLLGKEKKVSGAGDTELPYILPADLTWACRRQPRSQRPNKTAHRTAYFL